MSGQRGAAGTDVRWGCVKTRKIKNNNNRKKADNKNKLEDQRKDRRGWGTIEGREEVEKNENEYFNKYKYKYKREQITTTLHVRNMRDSCWQCWLRDDGTDDEGSDGVTVTVTRAGH